jgi:hypothetical protein
MICLTFVGWRFCVVLARLFEPSIGAAALQHMREDFHLTAYQADTTPDDMMGKKHRHGRPESCLSGYQRLANAAGQQPGLARAVNLTHLETNEHPEHGSEQAQEYH